MRIGYGYDVHKLVSGRPLIIGGIKIPFDRGLSGHSDADVLLHAVTDALLGAAALGDIGTHFPDDEAAYEDIDSRILLRNTGKLITGEGYAIENIDSTVVAQKPKLAPYIESMQRCIAEVLEIDVSRVSVKATTSEGLGFEGNLEGMSARAVALIAKGQG